MTHRFLRRGEIENLRQFFAFCRDRERTRTNPAKALKRSCLLEANDVKPFTSAEIVRIIAACDQIGRANYERLRARAMVLLMRYAESVRIPLSLRHTIFGSVALPRAVLF